MARSVAGELSLQIALVGKRLRKFEKDLSLEIVRELELLGMDILEASNDKCPYLTGELRNSGTVAISPSGGSPIIIWEIKGANSSGGGDITRINTIDSPSSKWSMEIYYDRMNGGFDVALYTHENLANPSHEGTGPKYLENALAYVGGENTLLQEISDAAGKVVTQFNSEMRM
jgi:hypothetical protein